MKWQKNYQMMHLLTEILQKVSSAKTKKEKVDLLQEYNNNGLRSILIINFDESLKFLLPEGEVPSHLMMHLQVQIILV